jgi:digeranylgeranylglycerophospholipid reductase
LTPSKTIGTGPADSMSPKRPDLDVVVVGAGPAGCECARRLAAAGYEVLLAEEHQQAGEPVHCTGVISTEAYRAFDLPQCAIQSELDAGELTSPGGITLRVELNGTRAYTVDRRAFDLALAERARQAGAIAVHRTRVKRLSVDRWGATVTGLSAGEPWSVRARGVIVATGAKSPLPQQVGLGSARGALFGAQAEVPIESRPTMQVWLGHRLVPGGFGWVVPGRQRWSRVGVLTRGSPREVLRHVAQQALQGIGEGPTDGMIRVHPIPSAPRCPTCTDRVLSVGDAAGQVKMTTGGGIYYGLLGASIAATVMAEGLAEGQLSARYLARYETLWKQLLGPEQRAGQRLRRLASAVTDEAMDAIFRSAESLGLARHLIDLVDFDWHARPGVGLALAVLSSAPGRGLARLKRLVMD